MGHLGHQCFSCAAKKVLATSSIVSLLRACCAPPRSDTEKLLERSCGRSDRLRIGALLCLVLGGGEAVASAAVDLQLERDLPGAQLLDHAVDRGERIALVLRAVQDQVHAFGVLR